LLASFLIVARGALQLLDLGFDASQFFLRLGDSFHIGVVSPVRGKVHGLSRAHPKIERGQHSSLRRREFGFVGHGDRCYKKP
jgi:hypothetical protein